MPDSLKISPALVAAQQAEAEVAQHLKGRHNFLLEAGAGAGKTYSLVEALRKLLKDEGASLRRKNQQIACITYTNRATEVITKRIDGDKLASVSTTHVFCWSLIRSFQPVLRQHFQTLDAWKERLAEGVPIAQQSVEYDLGYRKLTEQIISLHHDDVLALTAIVLGMPKFQAVIAGRFPYILIDEYQDTNADLMTAIKEHLIGRKGGPLIGLFGDHWQRIYDQTCGHVADPDLMEVGKRANFRSATSIVSILNNMRPDLPQAFKDEDFVGSAVVFHTNGWKGSRRPAGAGGHWTGDLPATEARQYLEECTDYLKKVGWDFAPDKTKVLLLTHSGLAAEQGYTQLAKAFPSSDYFIRKTDEHIAFFAEKLESAVEAYIERRFGQVFELLGEDAPRLSSQAEKRTWSEAMDKLVELRTRGTVGDVVDHLLEFKHPRLPEKVFKREKDAREWVDSKTEPTPSAVTIVRNLRAVPYSEVIALVGYLNGHTPFTTKHNTKGDEFENVLVVLGRGWNRYDFDQLLQWMAKPGSVTPDKLSAFERNRNLFYVCCSRSITNLALLFTQQLSPASLSLLISWFGQRQVNDVGAGGFAALSAK
jgi:DNA helicase-2/ATP-dependent DNA helicase PcrA